MGGDFFQMPKFFVDRSNISSDKIIITGEDVIHIKKVLRLRCGDNIIVSDGNCVDHFSKVESIESDKVVAGIINSEKNCSEPPIDVTLYQGIPKSDKMDFIIQKSVELGVCRIVPVITDRTIVRIDGKKDSVNKVSRWQRIALEAAKQCNRGIVPTIEQPVSFKQALEDLGSFDLTLMPYEKENSIKMKEYLRRDLYRKISIFIGPEGGFTEKEVETAVQAGAASVTLGPRILRTETAGMMVLSILMYTLGDVG